MGGDMLAFDNIYNQYSRRLFSFVMRYLKSEADAEEIVQDVFMKLWESRSKINSTLSFESYLFTISYNSTMSLLRKRLSEQKYIDYLSTHQELETAPDCISKINYDELEQQVSMLLDKVTPRQKEIFLLSREDNLSHEEIAQKLNISPRTVKNHIVSVNNLLKSNMKTPLMINILFCSLFI